MEEGIGNSDARQDVAAEMSVVTHIVNREHYRQIPDHRIIAINGSQKNGKKRSLPVVTMEDIGGPDMLGDFNRGAGPFVVAVGVVGVIEMGRAHVSTSVTFLFLV